jgi:hypothetical protein
VNVIPAAAHDDGVKQTLLGFIVLLEHFRPDGVLVELFADEISLRTRAKANAASSVVSRDAMHHHLIDNHHP